VVPALLVPDEISRIDAGAIWSYEHEHEHHENGEPRWQLSVGNAEVGRTASVDSSFTLRKLRLRDRSLAIDYEERPPVRRSTTIETILVYEPSFDEPLDTDRFRFVAPTRR
jgi:hypothetical protein